MTIITLYQFEECPFCAKVRAKLAEKNLDYKKINVSPDRNDPQRKELLEKSGVATVPIIEVEGVFIGESDEIVKYIEENL